MDTEPLVQPNRCQVSEQEPSSFRVIGAAYLLVEGRIRTSAKSQQGGGRELRRGPDHEGVQKEQKRGLVVHSVSLNEPYPAVTRWETCLEQVQRRRAIGA